MSSNKKLFYQWHWKKNCCGIFGKSVVRNCKQFLSDGLKWHIFLTIYCTLTLLQTFKLYFWEYWVYKRHDSNACGLKVMTVTKDTTSEFFVSFSRNLRTVLASPFSSDVQFLTSEESCWRWFCVTTRLSHSRRCHDPERGDKCVIQ